MNSGMVLEDFCCFAVHSEPMKKSCHVGGRGKATLLSCWWTAVVLASFNKNTSSSNASPAGLHCVHVHVLTQLMPPTPRGRNLSLHLTAAQRARQGLRSAAGEGPARPAQALTSALLLPHPFISGFRLIVLVSPVISLRCLISPEPE